jgi:thioredoxin-related protein
MKMIKTVFLVISIFCTSHTSFAQDKDVKWYEDKDEAIQTAKKQDKNILLLSGSNTCGNCNAAKKFLNEDPSLRKVVDENFILWFCDENNNNNNQSDIYRPAGLYILPLLCVIDPNNPVPALTSSTGYKNAVEIQLMLENYLPVFSDEWHRDRTEAFDAAKKQKKNILLLYGRNTCSNCNDAKEIIKNDPAVNKIIEENFILWFCNIDNEVKIKQGSEYRAAFAASSVPLPLLCIINPYNPVPALASSIGARDQNEIQHFLNGNLPAVNEEIYRIPANAFITDNSLTVSNTVENEIIYVYTAGGQLIDSFEKTNHIITRNATTYPKELLLINSSRGWSMKLLRR